MGSNRSRPGFGRRDKAEPDIVRELEASGWSVLKLSTRNGPDLAIARGGRNVLVEVKTGKAKLRPGQAEWSERWNGVIVVLRTVADVAALNAGIAQGEP